MLMWNIKSPDLFTRHLRYRNYKPVLNVSWVVTFVESPRAILQKSDETESVGSNNPLRKDCNARYTMDPLKR